MTKYKGDIRRDFLETRILWKLLEEEMEERVGIQVRTLDH